MRFIKLILISVVVFFLLFCIVSFFIPSHIRVLRVVSIANNHDSLLNRVSDLSKWKNWYPDFEQVALTDELTMDGRVVKASANGIQLSVQEATDSSVVVVIQKADKKPIISGWQINKDIRKDSLALQGYMDFELNWYPWEKFSSLMLDKNYGDLILKGLFALKDK